MRPSVGRVVHFMSGTACTAAIITRVGDWPPGVSEADKDNIAVPVDLHVFHPRGSASSWIGADVTAMQSEAGREHGTWHWPERV